MPRYTIRGRPSNFAAPSWEPLIDLVGLRLVGEFMWMLEILLEDDTRLHAYKHIDTRRYLHLHEDGGRAFLGVGAERYREIHPRTALAAVFADWEPTPRDDDRGAMQTALAGAYARADLYTDLARDD